MSAANFFFLPLPSFTLHHFINLSLHCIHLPPQGKPERDHTPGVLSGTSTSTSTDRRVDCENTAIGLSLSGEVIQCLNGLDMDLFLEKNHVVEHINKLDVHEALRPAKFYPP